MTTRYVQLVGGPFAGQMHAIMPPDVREFFLVQSAPDAFPIVVAFYVINAGGETATFSRFESTTRDGTTTTTWAS